MRAFICDLGICVKSISEISLTLARLKESCLMGKSLVPDNNTFDLKSVIKKCSL